MKKNLLLILFLSFLIFSSQAQPPIEWQKCLGGSGGEAAYSVQQTSDSGYIIAGFTSSSDTSVTGYHGGWDYWIVKTNIIGNVQWEHCFGGSGYEKAHSVDETLDGGYIVAGISRSNDGDVSGHQGSPPYYDDYWIVKLNNNGNLQWQKCFGGSMSDVGHSVQQTTDGGYIVAGFTQSDDGDITVHYGGIGGSDVWVLKLDGSGNMQWQKAYGGTNFDEAFSVVQTSDGGYVVAGTSASNDIDVSGNHGGLDYWIIKLDAGGIMQWQKSLGGSNHEQATSIQQTSEGGYIVSGYSQSNDGDVSGNHGYRDFWIVKLDNIGTIQWQKSIGGTSWDEAYSVQQSVDGGYIVAGKTISNNGDIIGNHGGDDVCLVKLDANGNIQWQKSLGGSNNDYAYSIQTTNDGGCIAVGCTQSNDGDVSGNHGGQDFWVVKLLKKSDITGKLFADINSNMSQDVNEASIGFHRINELNTGNFSFSQHDGLYVLSAIDTGNFIVSAASMPYYNAAPSQYTGYFPQFDLTDSLNDFAFQPAVAINDLCVSITPPNNFRPGFNSVYNIHYENPGTTVLTPTIIFFKDNFFSFVSSSLVPASVTTDSITWNLPPIAPFQQGNISVTLNVNSGTPIGTFVHCYSRIEPVAGDANPACNYGGWEPPLVVTASYDPNEIIVSRSSLVSTELGSPPFLNYIIYFQNTGNDTAFTVKIVDSIPSFLNASSMELAGLSYPADIQFNPITRNLTIRYDNILLPDSTTDEQGSHGYIHYRIKPMTTLVAGDTIKNNARIYFDYNAPVLTNTTITRIVTPVASPVTSTDVTCFGAGNGSAIVNPSGGTPPYTYQWSPVINTAQSISNLSPGNYFVTVTDAEGYTATASAIISEPPVLSLTANQTNIDCAGNNNGSANATAGGGTPGYTYSWNTVPVQTTATANNLSAGTYVVTITDANGCTTTASQTIIEHPLPNASITPSGPTTFCQGDSVTLTSSAASSYLWSDNSNSQSIIVTTSGNYTVTVTDANNCTASSSAISVTVNPLPTASITPNGPTTFCQGGSVTLTANGANNYLWSDNSTSQSINVTSSGNYSVTVTDGNNCSASASQAVTVNPLPSASITAGGPTTFCQGGSVTLAANGANNYLWSDNSTSQSINVTSSGNYFVTVTDANNCSSASPSTIVTVNPNPPMPNINLVFDSLVSDLANGYQWYFNSTLIPGATSQGYHPIQNGNYSVVVNDANNCTASSADYPFILTEVESSIATGEIFIYPNPASSELVVGSPDAFGQDADMKSSASGDKAEIAIYNLIGEKVFSQKLKAKSPQQVIDVSGLQSGVYFVQVKTQEGILRTKLIKL